MPPPYTIYGMSTSIDIPGGNPMKKLSIVLLCLLLAFSFVSCEKDKSGDMITNYENFMTGLVGSSYTYDLFRQQLPGETGEANVDLSGKLVYDVEDFVELYLSNEAISVPSTSSVYFTEGKITGTKADNSGNYTITDAKFKVNYKESVESTETKELDFLINGTFELSENEEAITESNTYNFTINNEKTYDVSYTMNANTGRFISANVNGNDVEIRLLNAMYSIAH